MQSFSEKQVILLDVIESLYQIVQRRELTDLDMQQAEEAYDIARKAVAEKRTIRRDTHCQNCETGAGICTCAD